jgi:hypothetical protein
MTTIPFLVEVRTDNLDMTFFFTLIARIVFTLEKQSAIANLKALSTTVSQKKPGHEIWCTVSNAFLSLLIVAKISWTEAVQRATKRY